MTNTKPNNVFAERDALQRENERLKQENETLKYRLQVVGDIAGENNLLRCRAEAELEAARNVADAAVAEQICRHVHARLRVFEPQGSIARCEVAMAVDDAEFALQVAVREYRKLKEEA